MTEEKLQNYLKYQNRLTFFIFGCFAAAIITMFILCLSMGAF